MMDMGIPICVQCHYNLTGNTSGTCPECGTPIPNDVTQLIDEGLTDQRKINDAATT